MELGLIRKIDIDSEMQHAYLDYAMSVIVARALPDARDGLKPVQRRILYAMYDMGLRTDSAFEKSARIVGEVLGKYHPHGDVAVYEAMARMGQDFSMRYLMVDGQGNFGSVDGDPPAAMRYTEARLTPIAMDVINQIEKDTVDFSENFDGTLTEPTVLPAAIPNLLVNGASGIAVGMATNIPPHNLGEVVDALVLMLEQWEKLDDLAVEDLMAFVKGPDFPTGGIIIQDPQSEGLVGAYATGRRKVIVQARAHLEEMVRGRTRIIVTELPYMVNKSALIERIADLVRDSSIEGIADLWDESDRQGMRIVIEISKTVEPEKILQQLYRHTPMQSTFGINMLALVNGEPHLLTLKHALRVYIEHRIEVVRRRSEFELAKAKARAHIIEGLLIALNNLDEVISIIRGSPDVDTARKRLMTRLKLTEIQAQAILDMQLRRLASLERKKIEDEYKLLTAQIKDLEGLLKSPRRMRQVVIDELKIVRQTYSDRRRTQIVTMKEGMSIKAMLTTTDAMPAQNVWVTISEDGRVLRTADDSQPRLDWGAPYWLLHTNTHHTLYLATDQGKAAAVAVHVLPEADKSPEGIPFYKVSPLPENEPLAVAFTFPPKSELVGENFLLTLTRAGMVKKSVLSELPGPSAQSFVLARVNEGDTLGWVRPTDGKSDLLLVTAQGMAIRFSEDDVRPMGLVAAGVNGLKLAVGDEVVGVEVLSKAADPKAKKLEVLLVASNGMAKRISLDDFPVQGRYGQGVIGWKQPRGVRLAGMAVGKGSARTVLLFTIAPSQSFRLDQAPLRTRANLGQAVIKLQAGDAVLGLTQYWNGVELFGEQTGLAGDEKVEKAAVKGKPAVKKEAMGKPASAKPVSGKSAPAKTAGAKTDVKKTTASKPSGNGTAAKATGKPVARDIQPELFAAVVSAGGKSQKKPAVTETPAPKIKGIMKPLKGSPATGTPAAGKGQAAGKPVPETPALKKEGVEGVLAGKNKAAPPPKVAPAGKTKPLTAPVKKPEAKAGSVSEAPKAAAGRKAGTGAGKAPASGGSAKPSPNTGTAPAARRQTPPVPGKTNGAKAERDVPKTPKTGSGGAKGKP